MVKKTVTEVEFGENVRFVKNDQVEMYYAAEGRVVTCKGGPPADGTIIGKEFSQAFCSKCFPLQQKEEENG